MPDRLRLDELLVIRGLYASRARARDAVRRGAIKVAGAVETRPARLLAADAGIEADDAASPYVSRAALKLIHGLDHFGIAVASRSCLDLGASTGGFTQVLLERGAAQVTVIDVGHGQLAAEIAANPRVTSIEGLNARDLAAMHLSRPVDLVVCDVSFISLKLALPPALALARAGAHLVALIKPQFEAGREVLGKGGIVSDPAIHDRVCREVAAFLEASDWTVLGLAPSPIAGGDGNREFLIAATKA
ncbi:MAG: TlyA family RNA methyltransferase [Rhizobiales bacterium]|nr:TlyA family RNA methyltransferase [Hyphomicrobiales bacterium]